MKKRRRKRTEADSLGTNDGESVETSSPTSLKTGAPSYGTIVYVNDTHDDSNRIGQDNEMQSSNLGFCPYHIVSLTLLGALDEISYFPAILLSNSFTMIQLNIAAFIASVLILIVIQFMLAIFTPLIDWVDKVSVLINIAINLSTKLFS